MKRLNQLASLYNNNNNKEDFYLYNRGEEAKDKRYAQVTTLTMYRKGRGNCDLK